MKEDEKQCPQCATKLEADGLCLVCLLNEGLDADDAPAQRTLSLPCEFAGHRLLREIASGGMGIVYEAEDLRLRRVVALKVVRHAHFASRDEIRRFLAESRSVAQLDHAGIVPVYECGEAEGLPFFTMRLAEGGSLAEWLKKHGAMPEREAAQMMLHIARATQHAHEHGVLHRDLKPANILLDAEGVPMLSDFGLAKQMDAEQHFTRSQAQVGTPHYMSPEQAAGRAREITTASDVWALGVMLCEMLTGHLPFRGDSAVEVMRRITSEEPQIGPGKKISSSVTSAISRDLATLMLRCLEKQPQRRLRGAGFLADELQRFLDGVPIESRAVDGMEWLWKLALRHKAAALAICGMALSLVAGTAVATWQAVEARRAQHVAEQERTEADDLSSMVLDSVNEMTSRGGSGESLSRASRLLTERLMTYEGGPWRKAKLLSGLSIIGGSREAERIISDAVEALEKVAGEDDAVLWELRSNLGGWRVENRTAQAADIDLLRRTLAWQRQHLGENVDVVNTLLFLGLGLKWSGRPELVAEAPRHLLDALGMHERLVAADEGYNVSYTVRLRFESQSALQKVGRMDEALALGRENCRAAVETLGREHMRSGYAFLRHARCCREAGLEDEALKCGREALECFWLALDPDHGEVESTISFVVELLTRRKERAALLQLRRDALRMADQKLGPVDEITIKRVVALLWTLSGQGQPHEAAKEGLEWLQRARRIDGSLPPVALPLLRRLSLEMRLAGRHTQAESLSRELLQMTLDAGPPGLAWFADLSDLAKALLDQGRAAEARNELEKVLAAFQQPAVAQMTLTKTELPLAMKRMRQAVEQMK